MRFRSLHNEDLQWLCTADAWVEVLRTLQPHLLVDIRIFHIGRPPDTFDRDMDILFGSTSIQRPVITDY